jgi:hypothetical protein
VARTRQSPATTDHQGCAQRRVGTLLGVLVLALRADETTHWLIVPTSGAPIRQAVLTPKSMVLLSLELGWSCDPRLVSREARVPLYLGAPLVELPTWLGGAAVLLAALPTSPDALGCVGFGVGGPADSRLLPYRARAGWRRMRGEAIAEERKARGGVVTAPATAQSRALGIGRRSPSRVACATGRLPSGAPTRARTRDANLPARWRAMCRRGRAAPDGPEGGAAQVGPVPTTGDHG